MPTDIDKLKAGAKIKYTGCNPKFWFIEIIANAVNNLTIGHTYTIRTKTINSSWTSITLKETGLHQYNLSWFEIL